MTGMSTRRKKQRMAKPPFDPLVNYANGEQGAYYAPWDISTLWQDDARTVPVENYGDPVRVMDDLSPNGNHAVAPTSTARGTYGRMPSTGIRNALVNTDNIGSFDGWGPTVITTPVYVEEFDDWEMEITAQQNTQGIQALPYVPGDGAVAGQIEIRKWAEPLDVVFHIRLRQSQGSATSPRAEVTLDPHTGDFSNSVGDGDVTDAGTHWKVTLSAVQDVPLRLLITLSQAPVGTKFAIRYPQLEEGDTPTPYQRVGNQYDVTQEGVPDVYYIETDGIDDCYQTESIDLTMYDSTSLAVGAQYLGTGSTEVVTELSPASDTYSGTYAIFRSSAGSWGARHRGTVRLDVRSSSPANNEVNVLSMSASISEPDLTAILQGELLNTTASQGTGTLGDYSLNLFSRDTSSFFFQGRFFGAIIVHPRSPYEEQNRQFLAKKAGVTL